MLERSSLIGRLLVSSPDVSIRDPRVAWAIAQMHEHSASELPIERLARHVNLSPSRFAHLFTAEVGTSPARYLRRLRFSRARMLLETTYLSVKEVMAHVGFNDASHFSRGFQQIYGVSPRVWRRRLARPPPNRGRIAKTSAEVGATDLSRSRIAGMAQE